MALGQANERKDAAPGAAGGGRANFKGRHLAIGGNVAFSIVAVLAIVVLMQWGSYYASGKADLTDSGVNSLSEGTERLLDGLDEKIRLTSMYFETDLEEPDQIKYRTKVADLLGLYQGANRSKIEVDFVNPLKDFAKRQKVLERLRGLERFAEELTGYDEVIRDLLDHKVVRVGEFIQGQLDALAGIQTGLANDTEKGDLGPIQDLMERWQRRLTTVTGDIADAIDAPQPRYEEAKSDVATLYRNLAEDLSAVVDYAGKLRRQRVGASAGMGDYLAEVEERYQPLIEELRAAGDKAGKLEPLELESVLRQLSDTANPVLVETEKDAKVIAFGTMWPAMAQGVGASGFKDRLFKGEEKLTAAILQLTEEKKTAVVFVRYSGPPLFFGGIPGQPMPAPYVNVKGVLEDANFVVEEWDVSSTDTPPQIDPKPVRTIYVVLRPSQPPQGPMAQSQQASFDEAHMHTVVQKLGEDPRAIFLAGWEPMAGPALFPAPYGYASYLSETWGIEIETDMLLLQAIPVGPEGFALSQASLGIGEFDKSDHPVAASLVGKLTELRLASPIGQVGEPLSELTFTPLLSCPRSESLWGVRSLQPYLEKARSGDPVQKEREDVLGPFTLAAVAEKGEGKIVVIGSSESMTDQVALSPVMMLTSQGFTLRQRNPGNMALLLNALHWLNDKEEWMDVGRPADFGTIEIAEGPALSFIRVLVVAIWPGLVVCCGLVAWFVRRR